MASITCRSRGFTVSRILSSHSLTRCRPKLGLCGGGTPRQRTWLGLASLGLQRGACFAILQFTGVPGHCRDYPPGSPLARHFISLESVAPRELDFESLVRDDASGLDQTLRVQADDLAWLFYTWRTTGRPKGAVAGAWQLRASNRLRNHRVRRRHDCVRPYSASWRAWACNESPVCRSDVWLQMIRGFEHRQPDLLDPPSKRDTVAG